MGVRILEGKESQAVLYCSTSGWAFGPLFGSLEEAERFIAVYPDDPRSLTQAQLLNRYSDFVQAHVCECGEVSGIEDAERKANQVCVDYCTCDDFPRKECRWCEAKEAALNWKPSGGERFVCASCQKKGSKK